MGQGLARASLALVLAATALPAAALEYRLVQHAEGVIVIAQGEFRSDEDQAFRRFLAGRRTRVEREPVAIYFNSDGGRLNGGIALGQEIRRRKLSTVVPVASTCASACVFAFLGGVVRQVEPGGRVGVHMATAQNSPEYLALLRRILAVREATIDQRISAIVQLNEQMAAKAAAAQIEHVITMGASIRLLHAAFDKAGSGVRWLTRPEMLDFNVVNVR